MRPCSGCLTPEVILIKAQPKIVVEDPSRHSGARYPEQRRYFLSIAVARRVRRLEPRPRRDDTEQVLLHVLSQRQLIYVVYEQEVNAPQPLQPGPPPPFARLALLPECPRP